MRRDFTSTWGVTFSRLSSISQVQTSPRWEACFYDFESRVEDGECGVLLTVIHQMVHELGNTGVNGRRGPEGSPVFGFAFLIGLEKKRVVFVLAASQIFNPHARLRGPSCKPQRAPGIYSTFSETLRSLYILWRKTILAKSGQIPQIAVQNKSKTRLKIC